VFAAILAALFTLLATIADQPAPEPPAPVVVVVPAPALVGGQDAEVSEAPAAAVAQQRESSDHAQSVPPSCAAGEEREGDLGCVAVQLPDETDGRQYDPAN
jgi:hypothetical protein